MTRGAQPSGHPHVGRQQSAGDEAYMRAAIEMARRGLLAGEPPVGACLVRNGDVVVALSNAVIGELDVTAHAEMRVIRAACRQLRELTLKGCRLFVTVEPCPMCLSACHYAGIPEIVYGARLTDMNALTGSELMGPDARSFGALFAGRATAVKVTGDCLREECRALLSEWADRFSKAP